MLLLAVFLFSTVFSTFCQVITVPPVSVTVPPLTTATFTCEGTGDILNWIVHSAELTNSVKHQRQISVTTTNTSNTNFSSVLTVNALPINDGLAISCEVITINPFNRTVSSSKLTIRGVSSVEDIRYNFTSNNSLLLTWSPPASFSNDIPVGSPVTYRILVTDEDGDIILNTTNTNIEVPNVTECDTFNISITALVEQYESLDNTMSHYNGSYSITEYDTQPLIPSISFELGCPPSKCLVSLMDGNTEVTDIINETEHIIEFKLLPFRHYELTAVVKNLRGKTKATYVTLISTFHTQEIIISSSYANGSVSVQCVLVPGATADGCHVIFTDNSNRMVLYMSLLLVQEEPTLVALPAGSYTVTAYDNVNGSLYGPAVNYPTPVEIIEIMPSTSSSSTHEGISSTASSEVILIPTSTTIPTLGTETTSTSGTINDTNNIVPIVAGTVSGSVLMILIILAVCVSIPVYKRKRMMNVQVLIRSGSATIQKPQAETDPYQDAQELVNEVPNTIGSPVQLTDGPIDEENPYHVTRSEFLPDYSTIPSHNVEGLMIPEPRPSLISTTTQETILEGSISSTTSNNIHDSAYTIEPAVTVNVSNDSDIDTVTNNTPATVAPTYASIAKRTDTTVTAVALPQHVVYDKVTGDINKNGGGVTVYPSDDISAIPPPPSYAATIAQEHDATVSNSQFVVPVHVTDDIAVVHGRYGKYPTTNTEDDYDVNTPVQAETSTIDENEIIVHPSAASVPSTDNEIRKVTDESPVAINQPSPVHFQWLVSIEESLHADDEYTVDEMFEVTKSENVEQKQETGALVLGITIKAELHVLVKRKMKIQKFNIFGDDENYEVVVAVH